MPVSLKKIRKKWRIVGPDGKIEKNRSGTAVDGGGSTSKTKVLAQVQAINLRLRRKKRK